jgi:hypothetical protein
MGNGLQNDRQKMTDRQKESQATTAVFELLKMGKPVGLATAVAIPAPLTAVRAQGRSRLKIWASIVTAEIEPATLASEILL